MLETDFPQQELIPFTTEGPGLSALLQNLDEYTEYSISVRTQKVVGPGHKINKIIICDRPRENQAYCAKNDFGVKSTMAIYDV